MHRSRIALMGKAAPFLSGALAVLLAGAVISSPESSFAASLQGLKLWWTVVFPALMPFLMLSEMLSASGFIHGAGVLLEPLLRLAFRLPGSSGWTLALGMTSGFPGGGQSTAQLHEKGRLTPGEAARLAALAHFASPVTILIVIGAAMLHSPAAGYVLLAVHWLSGFAAGITTAWFPHIRKNPPIIEAGSSGAGSMPAHISPRDSLPKRSAAAAAEARRRDGRSFGRLLGDSVASAVQNLMMAGGYMIMFSVVIHIAERLLPKLPSIIPAGLLEIHLGAQSLTSAASSLPGGALSPLGIALLSAALGWSGICAQLQTLAVLKPAGVRYLPFAAFRLLHGLYGFLMGLTVYKPLLAAQQAAKSVFAYQGIPLAAGSSAFSAWAYVPGMLLMLGTVFSGFLLLSAVVRITSTRRSRRT